MEVKLTRYVTVQEVPAAVGHHTINMPCPPQVGWVIAIGPDCKAAVIAVQYVVHSGALVANLEPIESDSSGLDTAIEKLRARGFEIKNHLGTPLSPPG